MSLIRALLSMVPFLVRDILMSVTCRVWIKPCSYYTTQPVQMSMCFRTLLFLGSWRHQELRWSSNLPAFYQTACYHSTHCPVLKTVVTPGAPPGQQSVTTSGHGLFPPLFFSSFRWDTPKGEIIRQNHRLKYKHLLRLAANGALNNPKARPAGSTQET
jgi:hypothetical protein